MPGMYETVTNLAYSKSPECPFIINETAMRELRSQLYKYGDKTMLPPDAQNGVKKSIAAALGGKRPTSEGNIYTVAYSYPVSAEHIAGSFVGTSPAVCQW